MAKIHDQNVTVYPLEKFRLSAMHSTGNVPNPISDLTVHKKRVTILLKKNTELEISE